MRLLICAIMDALCLWVLWRCTDKSSAWAEYDLRTSPKRGKEVIPLPMLIWKKFIRSDRGKMGARWNGLSDNGAVMAIILRITWTV